MDHWVKSGIFLFWTFCWCALYLYHIITVGVGSRREGTIDASGCKIRSSQSRRCCSLSINNVASDNCWSLRLSDASTESLLTLGDTLRSTTEGTEGRTTRHLMCDSDSISYSSKTAARVASDLLSNYCVNDGTTHTRNQITHLTVLPQHVSWVGSHLKFTVPTCSSKHDWNFKLKIPRFCKFLTKIH